MRVDTAETHAIMTRFQQAPKLTIQSVPQLCVLGHRFSLRPAGPISLLPQYICFVRGPR